MWSGKEIWPNAVPSESLANSCENHRLNWLIHTLEMDSMPLDGKELESGKTWTHSEVYCHPCNLEVSAC